MRIHDSRMPTGHPGQHECAIAIGSLSAYKLHHMIACKILGVSKLGRAAFAGCLQVRLDQESLEAKLHLSESKMQLSAESEQRLQDFSADLQERENAAKQQLEESHRWLLSI